MAGHIEAAEALAIEAFVAAPARTRALARVVSALAGTAVRLQIEEGAALAQGWPGVSTADPLSDGENHIVSRISKCF